MAGAIAALTVSACGSPGNSTVTLIGSNAGVPFVWGVVTTDSVAMAAIRTTVGSNGTVQDGDVHSGTRVCGYNVTKNGHSYQVDYYTNNAAAASAIESGACSSDAQQQLLTAAP